MRRASNVVLVAILILSISVPHLALPHSWLYGSLFQILLIFILVVLVCWTLLSNMLLDTPVFIKAIDILILCFGFIHLLNIDTESMDHNSSLVIGTSTLTYFAIKLLLYHVPFDRAFSFFTFSISLALAIQIVFLLLQLSGAILNGNPTYKVGGSFGHPGYTLGISSIGLLTILSNPQFMQKDKKLRALFFVFFVVISLFSIYTLSRASILISALSIVLLFKHYSFTKWFARPKWKVVLLVGLIGAGAGYLAWVKSDSLQGRLFIWQKSVDLVASKPLWGHGTDSFTKVYNEYQIDYFQKGLSSDKEKILADFVNLPYNDFILIAVEQGALGICILLALMLLILGKVIKDLKYDKYYIFPFIGFVILMSFWDILQEPVYSNLLYISFAYWQD